MTFFIMFMIKNLKIVKAEIQKTKNQTTPIKKIKIYNIK